MFVQTWNKYLPVLKILLKRSLVSDQTLAMNASDFQRAAGGRKVKFSFSVTLHKARLQMKDNPPPIAKEFVSILQQDFTIRKFIENYDLEFSLNSNLQLIIKNVTPPVTEDNLIETPDTKIEE